MRLCNKPSGLSHWTRRMIMLNIDLPVKSMPLSTSHFRLSASVKLLRRSHKEYRKAAQQVLMLAP
ncbi:hypothetical protein EV356DRAFT_499260 [Viridothelium virens]|uniref:Uncharacterized protein n=1 Tax=Viridothelium virens TaxID=1048519 RepID=A0A6A6HCY9_VIRVR|nr:hypothetical protein EV356DRAFT_499260 [Viridothelium virens]